MKFAELKKQAETQGNPDDLFQIGLVYEQGQYQEEVIDKNVEQAVYWYQLAANRGSSKAHLNLAYLYYDGIPQPDWKLALLHYTISADLGDYHGAYMSGYMYQQGQGIGTPDLKKAAHYYHLAQKLLRLLSEETDINDEIPSELREAINNTSLPLSEEDIRVIPSTTARFADLQKELAVQHQQLLQQQGRQQALLVKFKEREKLRTDYLEKKQQYKKDLAENQAQLQLCDTNIKGLNQEIDQINEKIKINKIESILNDTEMNPAFKEKYKQLQRDSEEKKQQREVQSTEHGNLRKIIGSLQENWQSHKQSMKAKLWEVIELPKEFPNFLEPTSESEESEIPDAIKRELEVPFSKDLSQEEDFTLDKEWQQQQEERQKLQATLHEKVAVVEKQEVRLSQEKIKLEQEEKDYQTASETLKVHNEEYERKARELEKIQKEDVTAELRSTYETKIKELKAERQQLEQERQQLLKEKKAIEEKKTEIKKQEDELQRLNKDLEDYKRREQNLVEKDNLFFNKVAKLRAELKEDNKEIGTITKRKRLNNEFFDRLYKTYISRMDEKYKKLKQMEVDLGESLFIAAREGNLQEISYRLSRGENPNQKNSEGNTLLHYAARGNLKLVKLLLKNPKTVPDIYSEDKRNPSPYEIAFHNGVSTEIVEILAKTCQYTPLHRAVLERDKQKIKQLLNENEALIITQANDRSGRTPHVLAEERSALNDRLSPELVAENKSLLQEICNFVDFQKIAPDLKVKYFASLQELIEKEISFIIVINELTILLNANPVLIRSLPFLRIVEDTKNNIEKNLKKFWINFGNITEKNFSNQIQQLHSLLTSKDFQNHIINSVVYYEDYKKVNKIQNILDSLVDKKLIPENLRQLDRDLLSIIFQRLGNYKLRLSELQKEYQLKFGNEKSNKTKLLIDEMMQWFKNVYDYVISNRMPGIKDLSYEKHIKGDKQSVSNHMKEVCQLFEQQLKAKNKSDTPQNEKFLQAVQDGDSALLQELFDKGADVNAKDSEETKASMLHWAAFSGKKSSIEFLLSKNANPNVLDADGENPLQWAQKGLNDETKEEEKKEFNDIITLLQTKIISKPSMVPATSASAKFIPQLTKGVGDCAFHALLGQWQWDPEQQRLLFMSKNVSEQRNQVADAIRKCKPEEPLFLLVKEGIKAIAMENRQVKGEIKGEKLKAIQEAYRQYQQNNIPSMVAAWTIFEKELQNYSDVIVYIGNFITEYCKQKSISLDRLASLQLKFSTCLNEDETLAGILLSIPELHKAHEEYNERCSRNFKWDEILADQVIIDEYANFIATPGQWLLQLEIHILAIVFNLRVEFYTKNLLQRDKEPIKLDIYNPGKEQTISICFNGSNHYEKMTNDNTLSLREPNLKKTGSSFWVPAEGLPHDPEMPKLIDESEDYESTQKSSQTSQLQ